MLLDQRNAWIAINYVFETKVETHEVLSCFPAYVLETFSQMDLGKPHFLNLLFGE